ncbi:hypothetical protein P5673_001946 [Acropora cervicornis]|uniref:Uncharacterized protein n=1 Tax=Acropora cervicornis TaxID=6130 RepID=A0AAD9R4Y1_ACRCE|nr:hypothetical protein P5673_001946 [Acropora cervicornis]
MGDASAGLLFIANCCGEMCWYGDKPKCFGNKAYLASVPEETSNPLSEEIAQVEVKALVAVVFRVEIAVRFAIAASVTSLEKVTGPAGLVQEAEIGLTAVNFRLFAEMELVEAPVSFVFYGRSFPASVAFVLDDSDGKFLPCFMASDGSIAGAGPIRGDGAMANAGGTAPAAGTTPEGETMGAGKSLFESGSRTSDGPRISFITITAKDKELSRKGANELDGIRFASEPLFTADMA